jgi:putative transposase
MAQSCVEVYLHIVFSTKERAPLIVPEMENRLYAYMQGIAKKRLVSILNINGTNNHIHILLRLHASVALSNLVKELKSYSTSWLKKEGILNFEWQDGYGAFSCSKSHLEPLVKYIKNQKDHHKYKTFEEEIKILTHKWGTNWAID